MVLKFLIDFFSRFMNKFINSDSVFQIHLHFVEMEANLMKHCVSLVFGGVGGLLADRD